MKVLMVRLRYVFLAAAVAFAAVAAVFAVRGAEAADVYWNGAGRSLPIYSVERTDKKIAITFDCAWERTIPTPFSPPWRQGACGRPSS